MEVSIETLDGLERRVRIALPSNAVEGEIASRVKEIAKTAWVDGFRPGKVPEQVIRTKYGQAIHEEIVAKLTVDSLRSVFTERGFDVVGSPNIEKNSYFAGAPLEIEATFEVMPQFELMDLSGITIEKHTVNLTDADVDLVLEKLRKQKATFQPVDRPAADGDQVKIDFEGSLDGAPLEQGSAQDFLLVLGSGSLIAGFETGIIGKRAGETFVISLNFPTDYFKEDLAGKPVQFSIVLKEVSEPQYPALDDAFAATMGVKAGDLASLRTEIKGNLTREIDRIVRDRLRESLTTKLLELYKIAAPKALVAEEQRRLQQQALNRFKSMMEHNADQVPDFSGVPKDLYAKEAEQRIQAGIILSQYMKAQEAKADPGKVRAAIEAIASAYEDPALITNWYYSDNGRLSQVESMVLEEQIIDSIIAQCNVSETAFTYEQLLEQEKADAAASQSN